MSIDLKEKVISQTKNLTTTEVNNVVNKKPQSIKDWIKTMEPEIKKALPKTITPERFTRLAMTALSVNPRLAECTPISFIGALMNAAQLGLEPNTPIGQAYLVPFKNKGKLEAQFQIGYKGLIDLAYRSGEFQSIYSHVVYENDEFDFQYGINTNLIHKPAKSNRGEPEWVYAIFKLINGGYGFEVMSIDDIKEHAKKYSKNFNSEYSPWSTDFNEMAKKTVIKKLLKYAPLKVEFVKEIIQDETIKNRIDLDMKDVESENVFEVEASYEVNDDVK